MIYIGYFSFDEMGPDGEPRHGYLSCALMADQPDDAARAFRRTISDLRESGGPYRHLTAVYIEDIVELPAIPSDRTVVTWYQSSEGAFPKSITRSLPAGTSSDARAYGLRQDVEAAGEASNGRYREGTPFIDFTTGRGRE
jgi:hypothetical protein